jgi:hypothetical protein
MSQAAQEFPILRDLSVGYKESFGKGQGYLEFWPADETGTSDAPRPQEFPMGTVGVEVYDPKTRPIDIMGDVASHHLIQTDPYVKKAYEVFETSLTGDQRARLQDQYEYARRNEGERRPFNEWYEHSGLPGYFRGYAFDQWENAAELYTPDQRQLFDNMMDYLRKPRAK